MSKFADIQIDPAIVKRAARGDVRAHEILYRAFATPVYSLCLRFTRVPAHAEDLVQETFIEVLRSIKQFRGEAAIGSWIRRIAVTKALMFLRSAWTSRSQSLADGWDDMTPGDAASHGISRHPDDAMDLDAALANLPTVSRVVVWLHDVGQDRKLLEVAAFKGLSAPATDARCRSGRPCSTGRYGEEFLENDERRKGRRDDLRIDC
jgi:RNA polymerase sigma-70 factor (ECF subfamily)